MIKHIVKENNRFMLRRNKNNTIRTNDVVTRSFELNYAEESIMDMLNASAGNKGADSKITLIYPEGISVSVDSLKSANSDYNEWKKHNLSHCVSVADAWLTWATETIHITENAAEEEQLRSEQRYFADYLRCISTNTYVENSNSTYSVEELEEHIADTRVIWVNYVAKNEETLKESRKTYQKRNFNKFFKQIEDAKKKISEAECLDTRNKAEWIEVIKDYTSTLSDYIDVVQMDAYAEVFTKDESVYDILPEKEKAYENLKAVIREKERLRKEPSAERIKNRKFIEEICIFISEDWMCPENQKFVVNYIRYLEEKDEYLCAMEQGEEYKGMYDYSDAEQNRLYNIYIDITHNLEAPLGIGNPTGSSEMKAEEVPNTEACNGSASKKVYATAHTVQGKINYYYESDETREMTRKLLEDWYCHNVNDFINKEDIETRRKRSAERASALPIGVSAIYKDVYTCAEGIKVEYEAALAMSKKLFVTSELLAEAGTKVENTFKDIRDQVNNPAEISDALLDYRRTFFSGRDEMQKFAQEATNSLRTVTSEKEMLLQKIKKAEEKEELLLMSDEELLAELDELTEINNRLGEVR